MVAKGLDIFDVLRLPIIWQEGIYEFNINVNTDNI